jgi:hypothetical protein
MAGQQSFFSSGRSTRHASMQEIAWMVIIMKLVQMSRPQSAISPSKSVLHQKIQNSFATYLPLSDSRVGWKSVSRYDSNLC